MTDETSGGAQDGSRRLYGRFKGKPLRRGQAGLLETLLPRLRLDAEALRSGALEPAALFPQPTDDIWLEIGFGGGEHLAAQAKANPDVGFIGCEFFLNGVAKMLRAIEQEGLENVRLHDHDARTILEALPEASLGKIFVLFPDPWPKTRHHKRRIIQSDVMDHFARLLRPGGELRFASDIDGYKDWMLRHARAHPHFTWQAAGPADWRDRPDDWPGTRYEAKAVREGRAPAYFRFRRD